MRDKSQFPSGRDAKRSGHQQRITLQNGAHRKVSPFSQALALHQAGRLAEAEKTYLQVLESQPNHFEAPFVHNNRGAALKELMRFDEALTSYDLAIALKPDYAEAFNNRGNVLMKLGRFEDAVASYAKAIALKPGFVNALNNRGAAFKELQRFEEALASYDKVTALRPHDPNACNNRGGVLHELRRFEEAVACYDRAIALRPDYADAFNNRGISLRELKRLDEALESYDKAIALKPDYTNAFYNRGGVLHELRRFEEALANYDRAIELEPDYAEAFNNRANVFAELRRFDEAVASYDKVIALKPDMARAHYNLGHVLESQDKLEEAEAAYRRSIALKPDFADAHNDLGTMLKFLGRFAEARRSVEQALQLLPTNPSYLLNLGELKPFAEGDPHLAILRKSGENIEALPVEKQVELHFVLAKACEDLGRPGETIQHLFAGNALRRAQIQYDEATELAGLEGVAKVFTPELIERFAGAGETASVPVFIVGMPRSGTSLIEQILATHPQVFGGGEVPNLSVVATSIAAARRCSPLLPDVMAQVSRSDLQRAGARYVSEITRLAPNAAHVTDKMPSNFRLAGLIHLILPNARIIHAVRDPLDTCFSCFSKLFAHGQYQTYDLGELGRYYRRYQLLMEHWQRVLPVGRILDVHYEDIVADLEVQARRILTHCDLEWNDRCLAFHNTDRPVRTASAIQVRQPIYQSAIGRAQQFAPFLAPLLDALSAPDSRRGCAPKMSPFQG